MVLTSMGGFAVTAPTLLSLEDIPDTWAPCEQIRQTRVAWRQAAPMVRLWTNPPDGGEDAGLLLVGVASDNVSGSWPWKNKVNDPSTGTLRLRIDHYLAKWLISIPENPDIKDNCVITVDHMGGYIRWSGLLKNWKVVKDSQGIRYLDAVFIDDLQYLQYLLGPPNPILPIDLFQWPRTFPLFGPAKWAISLLILLQLIRLNGNLWNLPEDPFDVDSWDALFDWSSWQVFINADPFDLDDSSMWVFLATRMQRIDATIADAMDDAQLTMTYRRILTIDGETCPVPGVSTCRNGALVLTVVDNSGIYAPAGTGTLGALATGFLTTVTEFLAGGIETIESFTSDNEALQPDEYYTAGYYGTVPSHPWVCVVDGPWTSIETSELTWSPATAVSVIVGGDDPLADQLAQLALEAVGAAISFFLFAGLVDLTSIADTIVYPFIEGCILAWLQYTNNSRAVDLGWVHLYEIFGTGAEANVWSLSSIVAFAGAFMHTESETAHTFTMGGSDRYLPGVDFAIGDRIGSTDIEVQNIVFIDQVAQMVLSWDYSADRPHDYEIQVGEAKAKLTQFERMGRMLSLMNTTMTNIGVHLLS